MEQQGITAFNQPASIVAQARQQMNNNAPVLNQVSQDSPLFNPSLQTPPQQPMPEKSPMARFSQGLMPQQPQVAPTAQPTTPQGSQKAPQNPLHQRADLIVRALTNHLAALDKMIGGHI